MCAAACNDIEPFPEGHPPRPPEPLEGFLHGLLTLDELFVAGGVRVIDTTRRTVLVPGCCSGLGEWRDWLRHLDGDGRPPDLGHDPSPFIERSGDTVRMTVDAETEGGPVIEVGAPELRASLGRVENDLRGFLGSARIWSGHHLPAHAAPLTAALGRALDVEPPAG
ncbi:hypothetical protein [Nocardiopsis protaetiae]|uniref:hypothetical protein n=1 Tax=Nocardiopsis protaetiae TaxID=3382270 RepID=UPI00387AD75B